MKKERQVAFRAALEAGALIRERVGQISSIDYKSAFNLVTDVDKASEELILKILHEVFPGDDFVAEEGGGNAKGSSRRWLIDPVDGTTNFAHGYPFFCVSIGLEENGEMVLGVIYEPIRDEMFYAIKGNGAFLNDQKIQVSKVETLTNSLLVTGFPPDTVTSAFDNMAQFNRFTNLSQGVRRDGSAALDLAYIACGRLDGYWEKKLAPWDVAAGSLIVEEAGGKVSDFTGAPLSVEEGIIIASNGLIHDEIIAVLAELKEKVRSS